MLQHAEAFAPFSRVPAPPFADGVAYVQSIPDVSRRGQTSLVVQARLLHKMTGPVWGSAHWSYNSTPARRAMLVQSDAGENMDTNTLLIVVLVLLVLGGGGFYYRRRA
jgi:LPXTG-motif cell wall-anchored protein